MQLSFVALAALAVLSPVSALLLDTPVGPTIAGDTTTIFWETAPGDPTEFDLVLVPAAGGPERLLIEAVIPTAQGSITVPVPCVPEGSYIWEATAASSLFDVLSSTAPIEITVGPRCLPT
ncbi:hypothetical protein PsYK624_124830 [Phanerochaete sordida]|uniref:Uncharacterized protein n=1 Tax=Phanerochaete sordida TaxID=48140 RepID=A0A9P3GMS6_9APHY|nr:hypothetical protein PsYK624_124830 [Phanerochaete sordida]